MELSLGSVLAQGTEVRLCSALLMTSRKEKEIKGAAEGAERVEKAVDRLGYDTKVVKDQPRTAILGCCVDMFRKQQMPKDQSCLVFIAGHGGQEDDSFEAADGTSVQLAEIYQPLMSSKCPCLEGKPRFFFMDYCRGDREDPSGAAPEQAGPSKAAVAGALANNMPAMSDFSFLFGFWMQQVAIIADKKSLFSSAFVTAINSLLDDVEMGTIDMFSMENAIKKEVGSMGAVDDTGSLCIQTVVSIKTSFKG